MPSSQIVRARVWLTPRNAEQLDALAKAVSSPTSSQYRKFISADEYRAQYAPTASQVASVSQWLTHSGLSVTAIGPDNHYLAVSGTADSVNAAFGVQLGTYLVNGKQTRAPSADVSVPDSVAGLVLAVTGLTPFGHHVKRADFGAPDAFVNGTQCSGYYGQRAGWNLPTFNGKQLPYSPCGYVPSQLRSAYGASTIGPGTGVTVAFTDAYDAPTLLADANEYATRHGDSAFAGGQFQDLSVPEDPSTEEDCGGNGWYGEQATDIEAIHGMAPGANVLYYGAASCLDDDLDAALAQVVSDNKASIITNSWGNYMFVRVNGVSYQVIDSTQIAAEESMFKQGAVQGIGFYFPSGDDGDDQEATGYKHPDWPTGDPWVTAVGGTSLAIGKAGNRVFETGWGTAKYLLSGDGHSWDVQLPFLYGSGGGFSQIFPRPWYQIGAIRPFPMGRGVPDIAVDGDPTTGMLIGETQLFTLASRFGPPGVHYGEYRIGGTSVSVQLFGAMHAVAEAAGGSRIGFANPLIYSLYRKPGVYFDVTPQGDPGNVRQDYVNGMNADDGILNTVRTFNQDSSLATGLGWDNVTGVGAPTSRYLSVVASILH